MMTLEAKKQLIASHPLFANLSNQELIALAKKMVIKRFHPNDILVKEGEIVDSVYFIYKGICEVQSSLSSILAINTPGEVIGLTDTEFYSTSGVRTATVIAQTEMSVLKLDLLDLHAFLEDHPHIISVRNSTEILLCMKLIKESLPFEKLTIEETRRLIEKIEKTTFPPNHSLFFQGQKAKKCFLILNGCIELFISRSNGKEEHIAFLNPPMIFGEAALLMDLPYDVSARTVKESQLLSIDREMLMEYKNEEEELANSLVGLTQASARPKRLSHIEEHSLSSDIKNYIITLKDPKAHNYFRLSEEGYFIWKLLDGKRTLREISIAVHQQFKLFNPRMVASFIMDLERAGFVEKNTLKKIPLINLPFFLTIFKKIRHYLEFFVSIGNADAWLTKTFNAGVYLVYKPMSQLAMAIITLVGMIFFIFRFSHHTNLLGNTSGAITLIIITYFFIFFSSGLHELAHAYTTKFFRRKVSYFGIGWFWLGPVAFCDTSDMWLCNKRKRMIVDLAGLYFDLFLAGVLSILTLFFSHPYIVLFIWLCAFYLYFDTIFYLSPLMELDGYYFLMDVLEENNLRFKAVDWLINEASVSWNKPYLWKQYKAEIIYWIACVLYLPFIQIGIPWLVLNFLLYGVLGVENPYYSLITAVLVISVSGIGVWAQIKQELHR